MVRSIEPDQVVCSGIAEARPAIYGMMLCRCAEMAAVFGRSLGKQSVIATASALHTAPNTTRTPVPPVLRHHAVDRPSHCRKSRSSVVCQLQEYFRPNSLWSRPLANDRSCVAIIFLTFLKNRRQRGFLSMRHREIRCCGQIG